MGVRLLVIVCLVSNRVGLHDHGLVRARQLNGSEHSFVLAKFQLGANKVAQGQILAVWILVAKLPNSDLLGCTA